MVAQFSDRFLAPVRLLGRDVVVLGVIAFCVAVGFGVLVPVLPVFAKSFGVGQFLVGAVVSAFAVMRLLTSPMCGRMIDFLGERVVLATGIGIVALSSALAGIAHSYLQLLLLRGAGGVGSAMFTVSAMTLLLGRTPAERRGRATAFYQGGFLLGGMAGPALGGVLAAISLTAPFFFYAGTLVVAGAVGLAFLTKDKRPSPAGDPSESDLLADATEDSLAHGAAGIEPEAEPVAPAGRMGKSASPTKPVSAIVGDVRFRAACLTNFAQGWNTFGVRSSLVPVLIVVVMGYNQAWTGYAFAIAAVVQTLAQGPAGAVVDRHGRRPVMIGAGLFAALAVAAVPFAGTMWVLIVVLCCYGLASAFQATAPASTVGDVAGEHGGRAVAIFSMCSDAGAIIGPLAAGALADHASYPVAFAVGAVLLALAGLYAIRMPHERPRVQVA